MPRTDIESSLENEGIGPGPGSDTEIAGDREKPPNPMKSGSHDDIPAFIARKINPRFAHRLKNRLRRL